MDHFTGGEDPASERKRRTALRVSLRTRKLRLESDAAGVRASIAEISKRITELEEVVAGGDALATLYDSKERLEDSYAQLVAEIASISTRFSDLALDGGMVEAQRIDDEFADLQRGAVSDTSSREVAAQRAMGRKEYSDELKRRRLAAQGRKVDSRVEQTKSGRPPVAPRHRPRVPHLPPTPKTDPASPARIPRASAHKGRAVVASPGEKGDISDLEARFAALKG